MATRKYAGGDADEAVVTRQSAAACMAEARRRGVPYPMAPTTRVGVPPGPGVGYTKHLTPVEKSRADGKFYFEVTPAMEALPAGAERVDGEDVAVVRDGVLKDADDFRPPDDEPEIVRTR